ncbi:hypothetical protein [Pelagibacterium halotolerans]|uniref:Uncharacterized protein n=1 Tax=Pelagibacterium halotolerans (strain DSM 22347 / JCM 15775 / CGMCC 1.7692 / B2) TaxID=1082931 RepID=G4R9U5_PELHB|nr:hypothetical protein [Pelagibacterium halotolerans]AEQ52472.1 hypothetical protein KKY_2464 [Pelagibacterium halotolerans B2]QJR17801.1 hypothetical protein HKM20_04730 [Pelagibacterium halotolerans]SEA37428.1 hypothetical protein SAMN05428936_103214 [Pelagibacterium halotolerans]
MSVSASQAPVLSIDLTRCAQWVAKVSAVIIALGVVREIVIGWIGLDTPLKELRHIALDAELSLPAFYSAVLILAIGAALMVIGRVVRQTGGVDARRWMVLGVIFCLMAVDEAASFHESLMMPLRNAFDLTGIFYYSWVIPGAIAVALIGAYYLPFLLRLPRRTALLFAIAGGAYVGGALGMELVGGAIENASSKATVAYSISILIEEGLEIVGLTLFFYALTDHVARVWGSVGLAFSARALATGDTALEPAPAQ